MVEVIKEHKQLFDTPAELICPITHTIMSDPVITPQGQIYDRNAMEQHLADGSTKDPLTQADLGTTPTLSPVHSLKTRAQDYASSTATKCMEIAADFNCARPVVYLRRAAELCSDMNMTMMGLSRESIQYLLSHPDSCYDSMALEMVSRSMTSGGRTTTAGVMLYHAARLASTMDTTASSSSNNNKENNGTMKSPMTDAMAIGGQRRVLVQRSIEALLLDEPPIDLDLVYTLSKVVSLGEVTWGGLLACVERLPPMMGLSNQNSNASSTSMQVRRANMSDLNDKLQATGSLAASYVAANFEGPNAPGAWKGPMPLNLNVVQAPPPPSTSTVSTPVTSPPSSSGPSSARTAYAIRIAEHVLTNKHLVLPVESRFEVTVALLRLYMERVSSREKNTERSILSLKSNVSEMQTALGRSTTELENLTTNLQLLRNLVNQAFAQQGETSHILGETSHALGETSRTVLQLESHLETIGSAVTELKTSVHKATEATRMRQEAQVNLTSSAQMDLERRLEALEATGRGGKRWWMRVLRPMPILALLPGVPGMLRTVAVAMPLLGQAAMEILPRRRGGKDKEEKEIKDNEVVAR